MKIKEEIITPEIWALGQPEYSWQEGTEAFLKRRPPTPADLVEETRIYNWFERVIVQGILCDLFTVILLGIGPFLMMLAFAMLLGVFIK